MFVQCPVVNPVNTCYINVINNDNYRFHRSLQPKSVQNAAVTLVQQCAPATFCSAPSLAAADLTIRPAASDHTESAIHYEKIVGYLAKG